MSIISIQLKESAKEELEGKGVFKYLDEEKADPPVYDETYSDDDGWKRFYWNAGDDNAPACIGGTDFAVYFREATLHGNPVSSDKLVIFFQGGGAAGEVPPPYTGATFLNRLKLHLFAS